MSLLMSVIGGTTLTVGALAAARYLLTLTTSATWSPLRAAARVSPATTPATRRDALSWLCIAMVMTVNGTLLLLSVRNEVVSLLASAVLTALILWQLRLVLVARRTPDPGYHTQRNALLSPPLLYTPPSTPFRSRPGPKAPAPFPTPPPTPPRPPPPALFIPPPPPPPLPPMSPPPN